MINKKIFQIIVFFFFLVIVLISTFNVSSAQPIKTSLVKFTLFKTQNDGFRFYKITKTDNIYTRDSSKDYRFTINIQRLACDITLENDCDNKVSNSDIGPYAYDIENMGYSDYLFKGYVRYFRPSASRQAAGYVRDPSLDIFVTNEQFSFSPFSPDDYPYFGKYKIGKRAPCDLNNQIAYECAQLGSFRASSTEKTLYDIQFNNPFRNNPSLRNGEISIFAQAFSTRIPVYYLAKIFSQSPTIDAEDNQVVTNDVFRLLFISSLYGYKDYFELVVDHNLWIQPSKEAATVRFWGSSPDWNGFIRAHNCPAGQYNFPCENEINVYGFPVEASDSGRNVLFKNFINGYLKGQSNINLIINVSGRSGDWKVNLCFDNYLKKVYTNVYRIRDVDYGNRNQGYEIFTDGKIRLAVDTNNNEGDVKIYVKRVPYINRTCSNLGYQELLDYSW